MKKIKYNGFSSEEEYERVLAVAEEAIRDDAGEIDVYLEDGTISVLTEYGRYYTALGEGVVFIDLFDTYLDAGGLMVYEDLNDSDEKMYNALNEEEVF